MCQWESLLSSLRRVCWLCWVRIANGPQTPLVLAHRPCPSGRHARANAPPTCLAMGGSALICWSPLPPVLVPADTPVESGARQHEHRKRPSMPFAALISISDVACAQSPCSIQRIGSCIQTSAPRHMRSAATEIERKASFFDRVRKRDRDSLAAAAAAAAAAAGLISTSGQSAQSEQGLRKTPAVADEPAALSTAQWARHGGGWVYGVCVCVCVCGRCVCVGVGGVGGRGSNKH